MEKYFRVTDPPSGLVFVFKFEPGFPGMLHIYARHLKAPNDAIEVWLAGSHWRDQVHQRYVAVHAGQEILWYWIVPDRVVMVVSCYDRH